MKHFKTYEAYKLGVNGVGSLRNSLTALKRQNINGIPCGTIPHLERETIV